MLFERHVKPFLEKALLRSPVVLLNGARQVGKSTLVFELLGDSLAGRMEIINLMPLSQGEIQNCEDLFIDAVFNKTKLKRS